MSRHYRVTALYLNEICGIIPRAAASELDYIYRRLREASYLWNTVATAYENRDTAESRWILRMAAFFWTVGIRPMPREVPRDATDFMNELATVLGTHRALLKRRPANGPWLSWRPEILEYLQAYHPGLVDNEFYEECLQRTLEIDAIIRSAKEGSFYSLPSLPAHLEKFYLQPEDIGITTEQLAGWLHQRLVEQAKTSFKVCRPMEFDGDSYPADIISLYRNIPGVLQALTQGVSLAETGITEEELRDVKRRLEEWLPDAILDPVVEGVSKGGVITFNQQVMPRFNQVLPG